MRAVPMGFIAATRALPAWPFRVFSPVETAVEVLDYAYHQPGVEANRPVRRSRGHLGSRGIIVVSLVRRNAVHVLLRVSAASNVINRVNASMPVARELRNTPTESLSEP